MIIKRKNLLISILFSTISLLTISNVTRWKEDAFWGCDAGGYYSYLPAIFIYHDLTTMDAYGQIEALHFPSYKKYGYYQNPTTKKWVNKYPVGMALMDLPFYLTAHFLSLNIPEATYDGYSEIFRLLIVLGTIFYTSCGLWFLSRLLNKYFSTKAVLITLAAIAFGTNLFTYNTYLAGLSPHPLLFFFISALLFYIDGWIKNPNFKYSFIIGLLVGLCVITRVTAGLIVVIPLFLFLRQIIKGKLNRPMLHISLSTLGFMSIAIIQMFYWHETTGHWIYYSYVEEGFDFLHPHIIDGLFSYRKGWFVYTPIALIGLIGLKQVYKSLTLKQYFYPFLIYFATVIYVVFSWRAWFYGGGFGARAMIDSYGVLAIPLCALIDSIFRLHKKGLSTILMTVLICFVSLNIFQSIQFERGVIPWDGTTKKYYWAIFGDIKGSEEKAKLLNEE